MNGEWNDKIFNIPEAGFNKLALEIFRFQYANNNVYKAYLDALGVNAPKVSRVEDIPFLPIKFFKTHTVQSSVFEPETIFESSGTSQTVNSRHLVRDLNLYEESFKKGFEYFYGPINNYCILGLLPAYLERTGSSLVYMVDKIITLSGHPQSGFYLNEYQKLSETLRQLEDKGQKTLLIGVSFALLDFFEQYPMNLKNTIVMETGGMKGRRKEMIRPELHVALSSGSGAATIHSEYGMTELLSQAYSKGDGIFNCPPWMKILIRDEEDPLLIKKTHQLKNLIPLSGAVNIIDLANIYSCSFIATDDAGKLYADGSFEILGRMDGSDLRGCSLMVM
jgi:Acyl-protein synthetase, LuxE